MAAEHDAPAGTVDALHWLDIVQQNKQLRCEVARLRRELAHAEHERDHARHDVNRLRREVSQRRRWWRR